jgi:TonB family protein
VEFDKVVKVQDRLLARELLMTERKKKLLSAQVDDVGELSTADPALIPPAGATEDKHGTADVPGSVMMGMLVQKMPPIYPGDALQARISGTVVIRAVIGRDGELHDFHVESAPWPSLAVSAISAVSHWQYKPYLVDGEPVEVQTAIRVIFTPVR